MQQQPQLPADFQATGKIYRFGDKEKLWAVGYEWTYKGNLYKLIHYGDWSQGDKNTWKSYDEKNQTPTFKKQEKNALEEIKLSLDVERVKKHTECAETWSREWDKIKPSKLLHPYMESKGLADNYGAKTDHNGTMLIKVIDDSGIVGVQKIFKTEEGFLKRFSTGIKKKGSFSHIGDFKESDHVYLCEGFATAASIHEATSYPVIVGLDSGNLFSAIVTLRKINPKCKIIICADVDKNQVGIKAANNCKSTFMNVIVKTPTFTLKDDKLTEFNDLHTREGLEVLHGQLSFSDNDFVKITPLGYLDDTYFYTSSVNSQVVAISASSHSDKTLYRLAPHEYWKKIHSDGDKVVWPLISSQLMEKCHDAGIFDPDKVRGRGAWKDAGKFVINDGKNPPPESGYHYQKLIQANYDINKPYTTEEMHDLLGAFQKLVYKNPYDYIYLASWLIQAQIFACLPWRFHLWLTGDKGSGKSHIIKWIHNSIPLSVLTNNATVAGIRQKIQNDATPICYDETEPDSGRMDGVIELARQMSSNDGAETLRGTSGGKAINMNTQTIFMFGSIQVQQLNPADASRIFIVEMAPVASQSEEDFSYVQDQFMKSGMSSERVFARAYECLPSIIKSIEVVKKNVLSKKLEARLADQLASMLACYHVYYSKEPMTDLECDLYLMDYGLVKSNYIKNNEESDADQCLTEILSTEVNHMSTTIMYCIEKAWKESDEGEHVKILASFGVRVFSENEVFIAAKSTKLSAKLKRFPDYTSILRRSPVCKKSADTQRIPYYSNKMVKGIRITLLPENQLR